MESLPSVAGLYSKRVSHSMHFRYENENESHQNGNESTEFPGQRREQVMGEIL